MSEAHWIWSVPDDERNRMRRNLLGSHKMFCRAFMYELEDVVIDEMEYIDLMCNFADDILSGNKKNYMCWMPPGYGKTMILTIMLIAHGFAINPNARTMHISYSDDLVKDNSSKIRDIINSPLFQALWPMKIREDTNAKGLWRLSEGGELKAASTSGQITGFRAGRMCDTYSGHIAIDDPIKPSDAISDAKRNQINSLFKSTVPSRLMHKDIPVVLVMQRLHEYDTADFFARGGFRKFHFDVLCIQANSSGKPPAFVGKYDFTTSIDYSIKPSAIWPRKETLQDLLDIRDANVESSPDEQGDYYYHAQYQQDPKSRADSLINAESINYYNELPELISNGFIRIDTAQTDSVKNDYTGMTLWGTDERFPNQLFCMDGDRIKAKPMQMFEFVADFIERACKNQGIKFQVRVIRIENANVGPALASYLEGELPMRGIQIKIELLKGEVKRYNKKTEKVETIAKNKFERTAYVLTWIEQGRIWLPQMPTKFTNCNFVSYTKDEITGFTMDDKHANDDMFDTIVLALIDVFHKVQKTFSYSGMRK